MLANRRSVRYDELLTATGKDKLLMDRKAVIGYLPSWMDSASYRDKLPFDQLTTIVYFSATLDADGTVTPPSGSWPPNDLIDRAKDADVPVELTVFRASGSALDTFLTSGSEVWDKAIQELGQLLTDNGFSGVSFDFEATNTGDTATMDGYLAAITQMTAALPTGSQTSIAVPGSGFRAMHLDELVNVVDVLFLMAYDFHWASAPTTGAVAPLPATNQAATFNVASLLDSLVGVTGKKKVVLGMPLYGYDWPADSNQPGASTSARAKTWTWSQVAASPPGQRLWDEVSQSPWISYQDDGVERQLWYEDLESVGLKLDLVNDRGVLGAGFWALGFESGTIGGTSDVWTLVAQKLGP